MKYLLLTLLLTGCTFNFTINTDYASQNEGDGVINEEVEGVYETEQSTDISAKLK